MGGEGARVGRGNCHGCTLQMLVFVDSIANSFPIDIIPLYLSLAFKLLITEEDHKMGEVCHVMLKRCMKTIYIGLIGSVVYV